MPAPDDARAWLDALAARVEDDESFLASIPDADVDRLLAAEDVRASGVAAAIRRRVREADARPRQKRRAGLWRWASGAAAALLVGVAVWAALPSASGPSAAGEVLIYRNELVQIVGPPTKGEDDLPPLARGARDLLAAAEADPPDRALAGDAARTLSAAIAGEPDPERAGAAAYFAGLAYRLAGDEDAARTTFRRVPAGTAYEADAARALAPGAPIVE